jgi:hypothetical protein
MWSPIPTGYFLFLLFILSSDIYVLKFNLVLLHPHTFSMQLTQTHGRGKVKSGYTHPTRFELEYYMIALVFVDSKLQVEEKIIDR